MAQPVISYPGAKWRFYKYMVDYFPTDMEVFIEPFFGGGSVTLSVADDPRFSNIKRMVGGDLYPEIWAMWNGIKESPDEVVGIAKKWFMEYCPHQLELAGLGFNAEDARKYTDPNYKYNVDKLESYEKDRVVNSLKVYDEVIKEGRVLWGWTQTVDTSKMSLAERAARMIIVSKISFSGMGDSGTLSKDRLCEFNLSQLDAVGPASELLQKVEILNVSFEETMKIGNDNPDVSFIFLDPPYANQESSGLYGKKGSTHKGFPHQHFAEYTKSMRCKWFITYDDSVKVRNMFKGLTVLGKPCYIRPFSIPGGYTMAGRTSSDALKGEELFITNYDLDTIDSVDLDDF